MFSKEANILLKKRGKISFSELTLEDVMRLSEEELDRLVEHTKPMVSKNQARLDRWIKAAPPRVCR
ncbi:MAG TPA: hypothetical protein ENH13_03265 [Euryarchaeota archaeon]|nr:hypothetical protein BMS3Abin16_01571 [archaeon BMS3Abin16]GBE56701.1 hypothetical protein BMS3Bbin16_00911 [archaeon BMS3Bbin16]HDH28132.1 hypothetical protein [Euryarchaeota archaeon]